MSDEATDREALAVGAVLENRHTGQQATIEAATDPTPHARRRYRLSVDARGAAAAVGWDEDALLEHWRVAGGAS